MRVEPTERSHGRRSSVPVLALIAGVGFGLLPTVAVCAQDETRQVMAEAGKVWYERYCTPCHGPGGAPGTATRNEKPVDLRTYVKNHGGKFPVQDWVNVIVAAPPNSLHTQVWQTIRDSQQETAAMYAASHGIVASIAMYVQSVQTK